MATWTGGLLGGELRGVSGNAVFVRTPHGVVVRDRVVPRDPMTPAQREVRAIQRRAAQAWGELDQEAVARWTRYALAVKRQPNNAFATLYKVLLRLDPGAQPPLAPPARPFFGDVIAVEVYSPSHDGSFVRGGPLRASEACGRARGESGSEPPPPAPSSMTSHMEEGVQSVTFSASGPNAPGVVTELLVQPLASRHRRAYLEKYRHAAYTDFANLRCSVPVRGPGWVACAYRFVNAETGQVTALAELGVVRAG